MAILKDHLALAETLHADMTGAHRRGEWPIVVDAGFYTVFHGMEAVNATECRDTYSFADAADVLETILVKNGFSEEFASDYRYLFYFRRGAIYGAHVPSDGQVGDYVRRVERCRAAIQSYLGTWTDRLPAGTGKGAAK